LWPKLLVYFLAGIAFGVKAYLTNSTLPAILPHMIGDLTFFTLVWPHDAARRLV
jgi:membrane protease YdiL (CAAX protease family)